ncbi:MAG TPA: hypothetical protein PKM88_15545 [bacterium]|nr:hypothetical protein [bacterium]
MKIIAMIGLLLLACIPAFAEFAPTAATDGRGNVVPQIWNGTDWVIDTGARNINWPAVQAASVIGGCTVPAYTVTGTCTSSGGLTAVLCDLGETYDLIYITCEDSAVVGFSDSTNWQNGIYVDRCMIVPMHTRYVWVCSQDAYVLPRCIRIHGVR